MSSNPITKPFEDYYRMSQRSPTNKLIFGLIAGLGVWFIGIILSILFNDIVSKNTFGETFFHDLPGLMLVIGFVLTLELWGLIPRLEG